jgi:hypothetical protein
MMASKRSILEVCNYHLFPHCDSCIIQHDVTTYLAPVSHPSSRLLYDPPNVLRFVYFFSIGLSNLSTILTFKQRIAALEILGEHKT